MRKQNIVLGSMIVLNIAQFNLWQYIKHNFFYKAETIQYLLAGALIYSLIVRVESLLLNAGKKLLKEIYWAKVLTFLWIIFGINDLVDLLFFDPTKFGWNEVAFTALAFIYTIAKLKRQWKMNNRA